LFARDVESGVHLLSDVGVAEPVLVAPALQPPGLTFDPPVSLHVMPSVVPRVEFVPSRFFPLPSFSTPPPSMVCMEVCQGVVASKRYFQQICSWEMVEQPMGDGSSQIRVWQLGSQWVH
jgi:hypothetical protein